MSQQYASNQPTGFKNHISNVAIVGAGGQVGSFIVSELLKTGKITVTAVTRSDSSSKVPEGVKVVKVSYDDQASIVTALQGQDALIITMGVRAPKDTVKKLVTAAAHANVPYVLPDEWGLDPTETQLGKDVFLGPPRAEVRGLIESLGKSSWIALVCSFWYEYSLAGGLDTYGVDVANKKVVFFDDGNVAINTSTWPQVGRAVARLLTLPILPQDASDTNPSLSGFKNKVCYVSSFNISQRDMFESVLRVTGAKESDWTIEKEGAKERFNAAAKAIQNGNMGAYSQLLYTRVFYPDGSGNFEKRHELANDKLGLPREDLDEATKRMLQWKNEGFFRK